MEAEQPLSVIIFNAMKDAVMEKIAKWNCDNWKSQEGVYRFKSRWGAEDVFYDYNIISKRVKYSVGAGEKFGS